MRNTSIQACCHWLFHFKVWSHRHFYVACFHPTGLTPARQWFIPLRGDKHLQKGLCLCVNVHNLCQCNFFQSREHTFYLPPPHRDLCLCPGCISVGANIKVSSASVLNSLNFNSFNKNASEKQTAFYKLLDCSKNTCSSSIICGWNMTTHHLVSPSITSHSARAHCFVMYMQTFCCCKSHNKCKTCL